MRERYSERIPVMQKYMPENVTWALQLINEGWRIRGAARITGTTVDEIQKWQAIIKEDKRHDIFNEGTSRRGNGNGQGGKGSERRNSEGGEDSGSIAAYSKAYNYRSRKSRSHQ